MPTMSFSATCNQSYSRHYAEIDKADDLPEQTDISGSTENREHALSGETNRAAGPEAKDSID
jgi:hypothetical protein